MRLKRPILLLFLTLFSLQGFAQESSSQGRPGQAAGYASRDATVLSVMGWGVGLAVGIATLCALVSDSSSSSSSHSH